MIIQDPLLKFLAFLTPLALKPEYSVITKSVPQLLMPLLPVSQGHQQPWYWLCGIKWSSSSNSKDFNCLYPFCVDRWWKMLRYFDVSLTKFHTKSIRIELWQWQGLCNWKKIQWHHCTMFRFYLHVTDFFFFRVWSHSLWPQISARSVDHLTSSPTLQPTCVKLWRQSVWRTSHMAASHMHCR